MKPILVLLPMVFLLAQDSVPAPGESEPVASYEEVLEEVVAAHDALEWERALSAIEHLSARSDLAERELAEISYARGVCLVRREQDEPSEPGEPSANGFLAAAAPFETARAMAGPGRLRLDATYDLGSVHLFEGERWRAQIPEIAGPAGMQPPAAMPPAEDAPDPLAEARARYLAAKGHFVERLRGDWRDEDTRADLELIQRRLRELDEIEEQREEQQQDQEQEDQEEGEEGEGESEESEDQEEGETSEQDREGDASEESQPSESEPSPGEQSTDTKEVDRPEDGGEAQSSATQQELTERHLTREQVMRLLDKLSELEKAGEAIRASLQEARQIPVTRDW